MPRRPIIIFDETVVDRTILFLTPLLKSAVRVRISNGDLYLHQVLPILAHIISPHLLDAGRLKSLPRNQPVMEVRNVFALIENAAGDATLNLHSERLRLLQIA
jgi:hypothetical protein